MTLAVVTVRCSFDDDVCMMMIMVMMVMLMTLLEPLMIDDFDGALEMDDVVL